MSADANGWNEGIFYVGSYGEKKDATIHVCKIDKETGALSVVQRVEGVENASFLSLHPEGKRLYAAKEIEQSNGVAGGEVVAIAIQPDSGLLGEVTSLASTLGAHPCYISVNEAGTALYAANYTGGSVSLHPLTADGELEAASAVMQHECEPGPIADRQEKPHAHCVSPVPGTSLVCAVDLGMDAVVTYRHEGQALVKTDEAKFFGGAGPRHIAYHPVLDAAYVANELASSVTLLRIDRAAGVLSVEQTYSTLPEGYDGYNDSADIHVSSDGRYLYSSNRGHNSIAVFAISSETGELSPVQHIGCGGELPRNFGMTPDGNYVLVANGKTNNIAVFRRDQEQGTLSPTEHELELNIPVCIRFGL
ncbi:lactonase family protein [Paenibacillus sp. 1011MAR3C5]|uniref:lactonase family protein n=1 Tax=Paenibacillus sp. 1011MAR3C5 TaxID=1675787 RepID=UPI000E6C4B59|nr:lactonase family protein [Paenibacillus sp. 1011MAR3C5]RJE88839.1 lactonase family protein [Paenibacillus sp. 1011MAR3C5]